MRRAGTPGFVGERLRQAREARMLMGVTLAELVGVTPSSISQYEKGKQTPSPDILVRIANVLNVRPALFTLPMPDAEAGSAIFWRSAASATVAQRRRAESRYDWLREVVSHLRLYLQFPRVNFPPAVVSPDPRLLQWDEIERLASSARQYWGLGDSPISDVTLMLENNGAIVASGELVAPSLDAFSQWLWESDTPYVYLGSDKQSAARWRFNVAHELGHLLLHRYVRRTGSERIEMHNLMEQQAHRFAGAFLLPAERFSEDLYAPTLDAMLALKAQVNVSVGVMIKRVADLSLASDEHVQRLWINYSRRKWRRREPLDGDVPVEEPRLLRRAVEMLVNANVQTKAQLRDRFGFGTIDFEDLVGLPRGYLESERLQLRLASDSTDDRSPASDRKVVPFRRQG
jgi:Zn-dependent peptidase ImmA (M78 family)/transcriptional regulator with XRE-family HTH domain